jgi:hypothetical protein
MLLLLLLFLPAALWAQAPSTSVNLQLHWDFDREIATSTVEIFESDRWGSTFFFTDFDFDSAGQTDSYFEISRDLRLMRLGKAAGNLSIQYNDGVLSDDAVGGKGIPSTWLAGAAVSDLTLGPAFFEVQALGRKELGADLGWQLTGVWDWPVTGTPFEFLGYVDWWSMGGSGMTAVQSEPQFQVRWNHWALGSEMELSRNFTGAWTARHGFEFNRWYLHPTIYARVYF